MVTHLVRPLTAYVHEPMYTAFSSLSCGPPDPFSDLLGGPMVTENRSEFCNVRVKFLFRREGPSISESLSAVDGLESDDLPSKLTNLKRNCLTKRRRIIAVHKRTNIPPAALNRRWESAAATNQEFESTILSSSIVNNFASWE